MSNEVMDFVQVCLRPDYIERPEIEELKALLCFNTIDWAEVAVGRTEPPSSCPEKWRNGSVILKENEIAKGRTGEVPSISPPVCQDPKTMHTPVYIILFLGS
ncbi:unnamed protein product [Hymenolepis diminuta]|uniref:Uncharacterized protein n=1 Tax=Hymenolepis diminuta TaxID=6216 RepID=A0A564YLR3_HYMDI|nr:unnamed protein product [Hymenolepis diminuta]VUZ44557.1 unnamed protein product [Hymenolepis diminuta]VUZ48202.1 unnamed protein product [Hymenolepis diminuta]